MLRKRQPSIMSYKEFSITDTKLHANGFMLYKITIKEFTPSGSLDFITESMIWKRYTDFKNLHRNLSIIHRDLYLPGKFPIFSKPKLFEKNDQDIIKLRISQARVLLNFANQHKALYLSKPMQDFFQNKTLLKTNSELSKLKESPMQPSQQHKEDTVHINQGETSTVSHSHLNEQDMKMFDPCSNKDTSDDAARNEWVEVVRVAAFGQESLENEEKLVRLDSPDPILQNSKSSIDVIQPALGTDEATQLLNELQINLSDEDIAAYHSKYHSRKNTNNLHNVCHDTYSKVSKSGQEPNLHTQTVKSHRVFHNVNRNEPSPASKELSDFEYKDYDTEAKEIDSSFNHAFAADAWSNNRNEPELLEIKTGVEENLGAARDEHRKSSKARAYLNQILQRKRLLSECDSNTPNVDTVEMSHKTTDNIKDVKSKNLATSNERCLSARRSSVPINILESKAGSQVSTTLPLDSGEEQRRLYLVDAAELVSSAQNAVVEEKYENAFSFYKSAINILLQGVQGDTDELRIQAVRRKTSKYLRKAEEIHEKYLKKIYNSSTLWTNDQVTAQTTFDESDFGTLNSPSESCTIPKLSKIRDEHYAQQIQSPRHTSKDLMEYKVLGIVGKVILVLNTCTKDTYVIKVLPKSCRKSRIRKAVIPTNVPYMVKLYRFYSTQNSMYLLLEHAAGGRLWNQLSAFFTLCQDKKQTKLSTSEVLENNKKEKFCDSPSENILEEGHKHISSPDDPLPSEARFTIDSVEAMSDEDQSLDKNFFDQTEVKPCDEIQDISENNLSNESSSTELLSEQDLSAVAFADSDQSNKSSVVQSLPTLSILNHSPSLRRIQVTDLSPCVSLNSSVEVDEIISDNVTDSTREARELDTERNVNEHGISTVDPSLIFRTSKVKSTDTENENLFRSVSSDTVNTHEDFKPAREEQNIFKLDEDLKCDVDEPKVESNSVSKSHFDLFRRMNVAISQTYRIPEHIISQWAAEMIIAIGTLHSVGILCRNLNPDNILLSADGHIRLTYFGKWRQIEPPSLCTLASSMYCAPEMTGVIYKRTEACDWWSLGVLLYELLVGKALCDAHPYGVNSHTNFRFPEFLSPEAQSLLTGLLQFYPNQRLGSGVRGLDDLMAHPFFAEISWDDLIEEYGNS